jgi:hypothetical protein
MNRLRRILMLLDALKLSKNLASVFVLESRRHITRPYMRVNHFGEAHYVDFLERTLSLLMEDIPS